MSKFVLKPITAIKGKKQYSQLVILPDSTDLEEIEIEKEKGELDIYEDNLEPKYQSAFKSVLAIMNLDANLIFLPHTKFKELNGVKDGIKEYEIKYQDLRIYAIKIPSGNLVILGGYKVSQGSDISRFRGLKQQYLNSIKKANNGKTRASKK